MWAVARIGIVVAFVLALMLHVVGFVVRLLVEDRPVASIDLGYFSGSGCGSGG